MSSTEHISPVDLERLKEASDWWLRLQDDSGPERASEWLMWSQKDPANLEAFERIEATALELRSLSREQRDAVVHEFAPRPEVPHCPRARRVRLPVWTAVAATVVIGTGLALFAAYRFLGGAASDETVYSTARALHQEVTLADGSRVSVGAKSVVAVRIRRRERLIQLREGEAYFEVTKDPQRPFIVNAGDLTVTAVGTAFDVRSIDGNVAVSVTEGRVRVTRVGGSTFEVGAGERAAYDSKANGFKLVVVNQEQATSWREGRLEFINEPLEVVIADVNRYSNLHLSISDPATARLTFTGTVMPEDLSAWLTALPSALPVRVDMQGHEVTVGSAR
jgi:transmembrane sensor